MNYREYYSQPFIEDLNAFRAWATASRVSHRENVERVFAIQPHIIQENSKVIASWGTERIGLFATALFFTVLVDQVCYTHFHYIYLKFQSLTLYPKLRGPCPGGCRNLHPSEIFSWLTPCLPQRDINFDMEYTPLVTSALPIMKQEVFDFFTHHAPTVDKETFWEKCAQHLPFQKHRETDR